MTDSKIFSATSTKHSKGSLIKLCAKYDLFLKPICKVNITVQIPGFNELGFQGKSLSTWEVADKLRQLCPSLLSPPTQLKVSGATVEFVRFVVELDSKPEVRKVVTSVDSQRIKLSGFPQALRVRAVEAPIECPRRHDWDAFFRDAMNIDETCPGERPDTVFIDHLPVRWFAAELSKTAGSLHSTVSKSSFPSPQILKEVFESFGAIRRVDIPMLDATQNPQLLAKFGVPEDIIACSIEASSSFTAKRLDNCFANGESSGFGKITPTTIKTLHNACVDTDISSLKENDFDSVTAMVMAGNNLTFSAYLQYMDYSKFSAAMEALRGMKLVYAPRTTGLSENTENSYFSAEIKVDFDRNKHLTDVSIKQREMARERLEKWLQRRKLNAELAEERRQRMNREAEEIAARRQREAEALAEAQRLADEAERNAERLARRERQRLRIEERYRRKKDALVQEKLLLEGRRTLLAQRRAAAIRILSAVLHQVARREEESERNHETKSRRSRFPLIDSSCQTTTFPSSDYSTLRLEMAPPIMHIPPKKTVETEITCPEKLAHRVPCVDINASQVSAGHLRKTLLAKREFQLRQRLLERHSSTRRNENLEMNSSI